MRTFLNLLYILVTLLISNVVFGQNGIVIDDFPGNLPMDCNTTFDYDILEVNSFIDNYIATAGVTNNCTTPSNNITWSHDFTGQDLIFDNDMCSGYLEVTFTVTNECGESDQTSCFIFTEDTTDPLLTSTSSSYDLFCGINGGLVGSQDLIDNDFYITVSDDCDVDIELNQYDDPSDILNNINCGESGNVYFYAEDNCYNYGDIEIVINAVIPTIGFVNANNPVLETETQVNICLELSHILSEPVSAEVTYLGGNATSNVDFQAVPTIQTVVFPAGSIEQCISVSLIDDMLVEANESIDFQITNTTSNDIIIEVGSNSASSAIILDDDDVDNDNIENSVDNCPDEFNPFQEDFDLDGVGDLCDDLNSISSVAEFQDYIYVNKTYSGVVVKSLDDACWVIVVQNDGSVSSVNVECPD